MSTTSDQVISIEREMKQSYMDYAMSVIIGRALPDVRDGLKPVQRRVLYAMFDEGNLSNRKHSKCAGVVGEVLKRFHPHGDSSVYDALVRLAQPWNMRYMLVDGQGNFGSIDGDTPAAYRYTECRLQSIAEQLLRDIDKDTVEFGPNFDDSTTEPLVLPGLVPNLLINGADGIAVGMATHIPPHNLSEIIDAALAVIERPDIDIAELMELVPGPDFPTGGVISGKAPIYKAYSTGRGILQIRAKTRVETIKISNREVEAIIVDEIPYQVNKSRLIERIAHLVNNKQIEGIARLRDESDRKGLRIVIEVKRDSTPEVVLNQLLKASPLQVSYGIINLAIVEGQPQVCSLKKLLNCFIDHRRDVVVRRTQYLLGQAKDRMHLLEGFRVVLLNLDEVIALIKASDNPTIARHELMAKYELSQVQAQAVLELRLQKLTGMERLAIEKEYEEKRREIEELMKLLGSTSEVDRVICSELLEIKEKYGDERRTDIIDAEADLEMIDLIEDQEMAVTISHQGYIKSIPLDAYSEQKRGGKGVTGVSSKGEDFISSFFVSSSHANLLCFTNLGRLYWLPVYKIPQASRIARGRAIVNLLQLNEEEQVSAIVPVREFLEDEYVFFATKRGVVRKTSMTAYSRPRKGGLNACGLDEDDALIGVAITNGSCEVVLATKSGKVIRFNESHVRAMGRSARGVKGVTLADGDEVVSMDVISEEDKQQESLASVLTVCERGYGKITLLSEYRETSRGGKGIISIQTSERNGPVVSSFIVTPSQGIMIVTSSGKIIRLSLGDLRTIGRNTSGVKLVNLDEDEKVLAVAHVAEEDMDDDESEAIVESDEETVEE